MVNSGKGKDVPIKFFEFWYGDRIRVDLVKSVKGPYAILFSISKSGRLIYDSNVEGDGIPNIVLNSIEVLQKRFGYKTIKIQYPFSK